MVAANPMQGTFHLTVCFGHTALGVRVVFAIYFNYFSGFIFLATGTFYDIGTLQAHFLSRSHTEVFLRSILHEVFTFHPQFTAEFDEVTAFFRFFRIIDSFQLFHLSFGVVGNYQLHRVHNGRYTNCAGIKVFAQGAFQQGKFIERIISGISDFIDKLVDRLRRISATAETTDSRHTGIIPSVHQFLFYQSQQITFAHQRIAQVQFVELGLTGTVVIQVFSFFQPVDEEVVERTVYYKLKRTQ